jgi:hypothetical protein
MHGRAFRCTDRVWSCNYAAPVRTYSYFRRCRVPDNSGGLAFPLSVIEYIHDLRIRE